jgi:hypothetical protein
LGRPLPLLKPHAILTSYAPATHVLTFGLLSAFVHCGQKRVRDYAMKLSVAAQWAALDDHFQQHADAVAHMWKYQINENGVRLSPFEREALIERHCELFGTWPN